MSTDRTISVAKALTTQLHTTEEAIDSALSEAANLIEAYISSRRAVKLAAMAGADVHEATLKAMMALNAAQQHMATAHKGLSRVQRQLKLENEIIPPFDKPEDPNDPSHGTVRNAARPVPRPERPLI